MLTNDEMSVAMQAVRDQVLALMRDHEQRAHDGRPCWGNRSSAIAFLAHCLGFKGNAIWIEVRQLLAEYDAHCTGKSCVHDGGPSRDL
jgi:hypothetical protein